MRLHFFLAALTASAFLAAAFLKFQDPFRHDLTHYFAFVEPLIAVAIVLNYPKRTFRGLACLLFAAMSVYSFVTLVGGSSSCGCLGKNQPVPTWAIFSFNLCMCLGWLGSCIKSIEVRLQFFWSAFIFSSVAVILSVLFGMSLQAYSIAQVRRANVAYVFSGAKILDAREKINVEEVITSTDAIFFAREGCSSCIEQSHEFALSCKATGAAGLIVIPRDFRNSEHLASEGLLTVEIRHSSDFLRKFPAAVRLDNGMIVGEYKIR
jgi:hypothetical protein